MEIQTLRCNCCNKILVTYIENGFRKYKSPVKACKKCGTRYADPRCYEIAVQGIPPETFSIPTYIFLAIFGAYILYRGIHLLGIYELGIPDEAQWVYPSVFIILGTILLLVGILEIIGIKSGIKLKKYDALKKESEERLSDKSYVYVLQDLGYDIPKNYL